MPPLRTRPRSDEIDFSGHFERSNFVVGDHAVANTYNGTVIQRIAPGSGPRPRRLASPRDRRPRDPVELLGRVDELDRIERALDAGTAIELHGPSGVGKTALLKHAALDASGRWPDGVLYERAGEQKLEDVLQWLFEVFWHCEVVFAPGPSRIGEYLRGIKALVVLDDVQLERTDAERLLEAARDAVFVLASEQPAMQEHSYPVGGLDGESAHRLLERVIGRPLTQDERAAGDRFIATAEASRLPCARRHDGARRGVSPGRAGE